MDKMEDFLKSIGISNKTASSKLEEDRITPDLFLQLEEEELRNSYYFQIADILCVRRHLKSVSASTGIFIYTYT